jgi:hypothetical protein
MKGCQDLLCVLLGNQGKGKSFALYFGGRELTYIQMTTHTFIQCFPFEGLPQFVLQLTTQKSSNFIPESFCFNIYSCFATETHLSC